MGADNSRMKHRVEMMYEYWYLAYRSSKLLDTFGDVGEAVGSAYTKYTPLLLNTMCTVV